MNDGNKSWQTGVWNKRLHTLITGRAAKGNVTVIARAKYLLKMRKGKESPKTPGGDTVSGDDNSPYSFEVDLHNHICEALMILSTGVPLSFFSNPFVKDWLRKLDRRHRPVYRVKLLRIIRCISDVQKSEVNEC